MPRVHRKNFFNWTPDEFERVYARLLENMKFVDIRIRSTAQTVEANKQLRVSCQQYTIDLNLKTSVRWAMQSTGVSVIISIEEPEHDWTGCVCDALADALIGAVRSLCELQHGIDD